VRGCGNRIGVGMGGKGLAWSVRSATLKGCRCTHGDRGPDGIRDGGEEWSGATGKV